MSLCRLLLRSLRRPTTVSPIFITTRSFAFSSAEEAAAERRRRKRRLRIEPPLNAIRPPPQHQPRDPNAPRLPDSTSSLVGPRLSLHNRVQSLIRADDLDAASAAARHSVFSSTRPTVFTCNAIIAAMYRAKRCSGRDKEAMDSYKSFMDREFRMTPATCNVLLEVLLKHDKKKEAWKLFDQMLDNHTPPNFQAVNSDTFNIMVNECFKHGKFDEALDTFRKVGTKINSKPFIMDVAGYRNIVSRFCEIGMMSEADTLFQESLSKHLSADVPTHTAMIDGYLKVGNIDDALRVFNKMVDRGLRVTATFGNRVFDELIKNGKVIECAQILSKMGGQDPKPDPTCYEVVIKGLCAEGLLDKSRELLDEVMRYGVGVTPALRESVTKVFKNAGKGEEIERLLDTNRIGYNSRPRPAYRPPPARYPSQLDRTHNPTYGHPQQRPPLPSAQMAGVHSPPSEFPSQMAAPQRYQTRSSQVAGTHNQSSGFQNSPPHFDTRIGGTHNPLSEFPSQTAAYQRYQTSPSQVAGTHNQPSGFQNSPPHFDTQIGGTHNLLSEFPSQTAAHQRYQTSPSQVAGTHNQPSGFLAQMAAQNSPPHFDTRMAGADNNHFSSGYPPQISGQQRPPLSPQMTGIHHQTPWGVSPPMNRSQMPTTGPSHLTGQPHHPQYQHTPRMQRASPQSTAKPYTPYGPSPQIDGYQPFGQQSGPQQTAEKPYQPSKLTTPMSGQHHPMSGPYPPMSEPSLPSHGSSGPGTSSQITGPYHPSSGTPPHFEESHQQQLEVPEQVAV
ncbi:putative tetratricopeptide-like helical domain-containing protein [Medicago truncatula]|uniref:Putative tetratricopeptide-like helical domain-containing protein n=1 Tax=Medicago truncatula TaxID=3880 RepID=A0A396GTW5_MEDTR|nr:putative tetratricopeptide-like helical domain-containing protein [Medicago truncatula]